MMAVGRSLSPAGEAARGGHPGPGPSFLVPGLAALVLLLVPAGCRLGPDPERPASPIDEGESSFHAAGEERRGPPRVSRWWERFGDVPTKRLVEQAIAHNQDLRAAAARVIEAHALVGEAFGRRLPALDAGLARDRSQRTFEFTGNRFSSTSTTYTFEASVSWQADLFGRLARLEEGAWYGALAAEADREGVLHSVIAGVVRLRAEIVTLERELALAEARVESFDRTRELVARRLAAELAGELELRAAEENLEESRGRVPELRHRLRAARHALAVLVGRRPGALDRPPDPGEEEGRSFAGLPPQPAPPVGVPAALLDRRPDLRASELRARAEQAGIGAALADLYPDFSLRAGVGGQSSEPEDLFDSAGRIWSLATEFAGKLFRGGALRAGVARARARAEAAAAEYAGAVLRACREVEDALSREATLRTRHRHAGRRLAAAREGERLARARYRGGVTSLLELLESRRRLYQAEQEVVLLERSAWNARVDLFLALGGDWIPPAGQEGKEEGER